MLKPQHDPKLALPRGRSPAALRAPGSLPRSDPTEQIDTCVSDFFVFFGCVCKNQPRGRSPAALRAPGSLPRSDPTEQIGTCVSDFFLLRLFVKTNSTEVRHTPHGGGGHYPAEGSRPRYARPAPSRGVTLESHVTRVEQHTQELDGRRPPVGSGERTSAACGRRLPKAADACLLPRRRGHTRRPPPRGGRRLRLRRQPPAPALLPKRAAHPRAGAPGVLIFPPYHPLAHGPNFETLARTLLALDGDQLASGGCRSLPPSGEGRAGAGAPHALHAQSAAAVA